MNIDKLKQVVQAANPEIMELKFGCKIKVSIGTLISKYGRQDNILECTIYAQSHGDFMATSSYDPARIVKQEKIVQILGRPIRLADVLHALTNCAKYPALIDYSVGLVFFHFKYEGDGATWNVLDDNLDNQSDETKQFLIDLLAKEAA